MNFKKLILLMLIGIVCSVSVVSAADMNDSIVESGFNDNPVVIDDLQNEIKNQEPVNLLNIEDFNSRMGGVRSVSFVSTVDMNDYINDFINNCTMESARPISVVSAEDMDDSIVERGFDENQVGTDALQNGLRNHEQLKNLMNTTLNTDSSSTVEKMPSLLKSSYGGGSGNAVGGVIKDGGKYPHGGNYPGESGSGSKSRPVGLI